MKKPMPWEIVRPYTGTDGTRYVVSEVTGELVELSKGILAILKLIREAYKYFDPDFFAKVKRIEREMEGTR